MRIYIKDIKDKGLDTEGQLTAEYIGLTKDDPLYFISPLDVTAHLTRAEDTLLAAIKVKGRFASYCYRTLEALERDWIESFTLDFSITKHTEFIDLDDDIRQEVILRTPMRVLSDSELQKEKQNPSVKLQEADESKAAEGPFKGLKVHQPLADLPDIEN